MEWQKAIEGHVWIINYCADIPDSQKGAIVRQDNGLFRVQDGGKQNILADQTAEQVPNALAQLGIANKGWE